MTKYLKLLLVALFATMTLSLASCKDDNDEPEGGDLVGTWMADQQPANIEYLQFKSNGDFAKIDVPGEMWDDPDLKPIAPETEVMKGKWTRNGDIINIVYDDGVKTSCKIEKITSKQLHVIVLGIKGVYERVPDSTVDKYLK